MSRNRLQEAGFGPGPYTPSELARGYAAVGALAPDAAAGDPVRSDPAFTAATSARDDARAVFDAVSAEWDAATAAVRAARGRRVPWQEATRLADAAAVAAERREAAWSRVVAANGAVLAAQHAATASAAAAAVS